MKLRKHLLDSVRSVCGYINASRERLAIAANHHDGELRLRLHVRHDFLLFFDWWDRKLHRLEAPRARMRLLGDEPGGDHLGVPDDQINQLAAKSVNVHPCMMPYITAFFLPRRDGDRPKVVPEGAVNFGFLGQLAESHPRDVIFTVEYSVRTAMEAVYTLLDIERGVPEPWGGSGYDIRALLNSAIVMRDGEKLKLPAPLEAF